MLARPWTVLAAAIVLAAPPAGAEDAGAPRVIETRPLKLIGDGLGRGTAPAPKSEIATVTPPLRLIGDGASAPRTPAPDRAPPPGVTIETRPLKLIGAKP